MKYLILVITMVIFSGCGIYEKRSIILSCEHGEIYFKWYTEKFVSESQDIIRNENLTTSGFYEVDGKRLKCVED